MNKELKYQTEQFDILYDTNDTRGDWIQANLAVYILIVNVI